MINNNDQLVILAGGYAKRLGKITKKIPKSLKYGNPPIKYYNDFIKLKNPILDWKKYLKIIPKPQDHRSNAVKKELLYLKNLNKTILALKKDIKHENNQKIVFLDLQHVQNQHLSILP